MAYVFDRTRYKTDQEAIAAGCNEYVSKPINLATLNNLIKKLFT